VTYLPYPEDRYAGPGGEASGRLRPAGAPPDLVNASGTKVHYLATGADTDGQLGLYRFEMGSGLGGPGPHFHRSITESFYVLSGAIRLFDGTGWVDGRPGDFLYIPQGGVHGFRNESGEPASMLILFTPGAPREDYFERVAQAASMSEEDRAEFYLRHDTFWV
jgi:mannose-6-phosphate isomerase-like protein (cupin superfamily)